MSGRQMAGSFSAYRKETSSLGDISPAHLRTQATARLTDTYLPPNPDYLTQFAVLTVSWDPSQSIWLEGSMPRFPKFSKTPSMRGVRGAMPKRVWGA